MKFSLILILTLYLSAAKANDLHLFKKYPELKKIPHLQILNGPTPLHPLLKLEEKLYSNAGRAPENRPRLWIKRDDMSWGPLGGNKARKLEFIMAKTLSKHSTTVVTSGMWGSNHCLATAAAARKLGLKSKLLLGPQPVTKNVKSKLLTFHALGARTKYYGSKITMGLGLAKHYLWSLFDRKLFYIPPGGTSKEGMLGYANAFLELFEQTGLTNLPSEIVVPVGTAGTSAGLLVGSCLAGVWEKTTIVGVGISHGILSNERLVRSKARELYRFIRKNLSKKNRKTLPKCDFEKSHKALVYLKRYSAPGYGAANQEVHQGMRLMRETEGLILDSTYSGKAFRYYLDKVQSILKTGDRPMPRLLFWLTYNSYDLNTVIEEHHWSNPQRKWLDLPSKFWKLFE
jgi:1-aminocyclopropane-1-carboxylate deaminase/D-cysteine desulfhydrase-like pyridoxal-dependent ACC family enzyme